MTNRCCAHQRAMGGPTPHFWRPTSACMPRCVVERGFARASRRFVARLTAALGSTLA